MKNQLLEIKSRLAFWNNWVNPFSRKGIVLFAQRVPRIYLFVCTLFALLGYVVLLIFPYWIFRLPISIVESWQQAASPEQWGYLGLQVLGLLVSIIVCIAMIKLRFSLPSGLEITREQLPRLFEQLDEISATYSSLANRINRVVLRDGFDISFLKTPRRIFPVYNVNTLVIGLPVLQTMKPIYFRALLARKIGQASLKHNPVTGWLSQLNDIWQQYSRAAKKTGQLAIPLAFFFNLYAKLYNLLLLGVFRFDELKADQYALDLINDQDVMEMITLEVVTRDFINKKYWPKINQMAKRSGKPEILPHANMLKVVRNGMKKEDYIASIDAAWHQEDDFRSPCPHFIERIKNLGHHKPLAPSPLGDTAAQLYLGNSLPSIIEKFDQKWLRQVQHFKKTQAVK